MSDFQWTIKKEEAALLLAQDELGMQEIAEKVGVTRQTIDNWRKWPEFAARIDEHVTAARRLIRSRGIAVIENRVKSQHDRWLRMHRVIAERAADPEMAAVPGGKTGLLVHNVKAIGSGESAERVDLYEVDTGLLKEMRELEQHVARELGQWTEKKDVTSGGKPIKAFLDVDDGGD